MTRLIVAAGGGGDAVAASMIDTALYGDIGERAVILTYSWDRFVVDPLPGPRGADEFTGLEPLTRSVRAVPAAARPIPPAGSTLPRLAGALPNRLALLDPGHGAEGVARQIEELVVALHPCTIDLLDVGGDILAKGDEPTLRSPLADSLALAACALVGAPVRLLVAGPGLDGELPAHDLRSLLGPVVRTLSSTDVRQIAPVLEWHPSEATGMLAATACGIRGTCRVRDAGLPVPLTEESPTVHEVALGEALSRNELARALMPTSTLAAAETVCREVCGFSEIDYERDKALRLGGQQPRRLDPGTVLARLDRFEAAARGQGITHTTFRHLTEALDLPGAQRDALRQSLITERPERYAAPLWRVTDHA